MPVASPGTTPALQFTIEGYLLPSEGLQELVCSDGTHLRVVGLLQDYPSGEMLWHLIPGTNSSGSISQVKVINVEPLPKGDGSAEDICQVVGRVLQISKRQGQVSALW